MYTMVYDITVGGYKVGMLDSVEIHKSVELLADTAVVKLPGAQYNTALDVEERLKRGDAVSVKIGYNETGLVEEFRGWLQSVSTDGGSIGLTCEDDLFTFRKSLGNIGSSGRSRKKNPASLSAAVPITFSGNGPTA